MNKILIITNKFDEREQLEAILQEFVEEGGELFFAGTREEGLEILKKEAPQLVFLDLNLAGTQSDWVKEGVQVIWMGLAHEIPEVGPNYLAKPLIPHEVLDRCHQVLGKGSAVEMPPM